MAASKRKKKVKAKGKGRVRAAQGGKAKKKKGLITRGLDFLSTGDDDFRENFEGQVAPLPIGGRPDMSRLGTDIASLSELGPSTFTTLEGARVGAPDALQKVSQLLGREVTQNELAVIQRFFEGRRIAKDFGAAAPVINRGFEVAKGLSQRAGFDKIGGPLSGVLELIPGIGSGDLTFGPTTSTASPENVDAAQRGIDSFNQGRGRFELPKTPPERSVRGKPSIPRGRHGGQMTAEAAESGRGVARQRFAVGGPTVGFGIDRSPKISGVDIPGINTLPGQEQGDVTQTRTDTEGTSDTTSTESGTGFTQNKADTGTLDSIIDELRNVTGFSGLGRSTLDEILKTGLPTDVSGITEAAKIRASQEFDDASNVIGERLANLGLVSSSAQTSAVSRERARLGERVSAAGMEAEVAAAEAAAGRRAGGVDQDRLGQNTRAGALGQAGDLAGRSAGLTSRQETGFDRTGTSSTKTTGSTTGTVSQSSPSDGALPQSGGFGVNTAPSRGRPSQTPHNFNLGRGPHTTGQRRLQNQGIRFAHGGKVPSFENWLKRLGQGLSGSGVQVRGLSAGADDEEANAVRRNQALAAFGGEEKAFELFQDPSSQAKLRNQAVEFLGRSGPQGVPSRGNLNPAQLMALAFGQNNAPVNVQGGMGARTKGLLGVDPTAFIGTELDFERASKGIGDLVGEQFLSEEGRKFQPGPAPADPRADRRVGFALGGPVEGDPEPIAAPNQGAVPQPELPQENGQMVPGLLDPRRQFFDDGGGVSPGVDAGVDTVPAMLRPEELVVTPELVEELMDVDPGLPQPGLITALQQLAQQPLEFGEEEGEFVAAGGGISRFATPEPRPPGSVFSLPELFAFLSQRQVPGEEGFEEAAFNIPPDTLMHPDREAFVGPPTPEGLRSDGLAEGHQDFFQPSFAPAPELAHLRKPSFSESVGEAGERKFTLEGGGALAGPLGAEGIRAGLDASKGLLSGGEGIAPSATRQLPGKPGSVEGSFSIIDPETGLPMDFGAQQLSRLDRAQKMADLTRSAIRTDPIGGPEKQARMLRALEIANREVDASVNEMIKGQEIAIKAFQADTNRTFAEGQLNESLSQTLVAKARLVTAEGVLAKQVLEAQAINPALRGALNMLEALAKNPGADAEVKGKLVALLEFHLQQSGIEFEKTGFLAALGFGGPDFVISQKTPQQGIPSTVPDSREPFAGGGLVQSPESTGAKAISDANDGNQELQALMSRAKAGMSAEDFQHIMEIM